MKLTISAAPHIKTRRTTKRIMLDVLIALIPASVAGIVFFGWQAAVILAISLLSAALTEFVYYILKEKIWAQPKEVLKKFVAQFDFTSLITGLLLGLCLPANLDGWYMPVLGSIFAVAVVKMLFGGTGKNIVNPALAGRIFLFISFTAMTSYPAANFGAIGAGVGGTLSTGATQLNNVLNGNPVLSLADLFLGTGVAGCIGETCKLALLIGGVYLVVRGVIKWYLPALSIAVAAVFGMALDGVFDLVLALQYALTGGLFLGAVFMATDYTTTPKSFWGNILYFAALGLLTAGLRKATGIEVVSFCIFIMNFLVFLIDLAIKVRPFGYARRKKEAKK